MAIHPYVRQSLNGRRSYEHIEVAARALGKPLPSKAIVHHVNDNTRDNRPSNLVILQDTTEHDALHYRRKVLRAGGDPWTQHLCAKCGGLKAPPAFYKQNGRRLGRRSICIACWHA
jgi:hypothetical protein